MSRTGGPGGEVRLPMGWWPSARRLVPAAVLRSVARPRMASTSYAPVREPWARALPVVPQHVPVRAARRARVAAAAGRPRARAALSRRRRAASGSRWSARSPPGSAASAATWVARARRRRADDASSRCGAAPRPGAPEPSDFARERRDPAIVGAVCAQCHSGPSPRFPDGAALRNSSESLDLAAGPCTGIRCIDCHDPHGGGLAGPAGTTIEERALAACTGCHAPLADPARASAHAGGAGHGGVSCLDCHMPRMVMGIDRYVRSHRSRRRRIRRCSAWRRTRATSATWSARWAGRWARSRARHGVALDPGRLAGPLDLDTRGGARCGSRARRPACG